LGEKLAAKVSIQHGRDGRGKLVVAYHSVDELEGILERIR
jgi:ParB family transcriptional regulator, chromosome partitioning protein